MSIYISIGTMFNVHSMKGYWVPTAVNITKILVWTVNQMSIYSILQPMFNVYYMKGNEAPATVKISKMYVLTGNQ